MHKATKQLDTVDQLSAIVFAPQKNAADYYTRVFEIIDFIESYFGTNICSEDVGEITLNELKAILETRIEFFSKYVATDEVGVFALADTAK